MKNEKEFLLARDDYLNTKLGDYRKKVKTLRGIVEIKENLLEVIDTLLPKDYTDRTVNKARKQDEIRKKMVVLEFQQHLLRKQVDGVIKGKSKEKKQPLHIEGRKGIVSIGD